MNNGKLVGLVVLLCVICPILVGFVWPVDATSETAWETGDPKDISNDAINAKLPVYVPYNDPFNNNMNVFDSTAFANFPVVITSNPGPVWNATDALGGAETITLDSGGYYTINDLGTWKNWGTNVAVIIPKDSWMDEIDMYDNGGVADLVVYYPQTDKMYYRHATSETFWPVESHKITFSASYGYEGATVTLYYYFYADGDGFADLSAGMKMPSYYANWFNGYKNKGFNIILNTVDSNLTDWIYVLDPDEYTDTRIAVWIDNGTIKMTVYRNSDQYYYGELGSMTIYNKVLLTVDYDTATISLSGLRGLNSYIDDYASSIRETITAEWQDPVIFYSLGVAKTAGSNAAWYVADTLSAVAETDGSSNFEMNLRDYTANGSCQLNIRNISQHGDKIGFTINSTYKLGNITNGNLSITGADGELITVPVNNMLIGLIGDKVYLNGYVLFEASSITKAQIYFYDDWKMSLIYYPVTETSVPGFAWLPGGFGLDVAGFCSVGMITSFGSALGLGVYGRRSGARVALVSLSAILCGATYLVLLMSGMS